MSTLSSFHSLIVEKQVFLCDAILVECKTTTKMKIVPSLFIETQETKQKREKTNQ